MKRARIVAALPVSGLAAMLSGAPHRFSPGETLRLRGTRSRPGTRCRNSTRRSISIFKSGVELASPSTPKESHSMPNITAKLLAAIVSCALLNVIPAAAQQQGPSRIRGTIESVDGNNLAVAARDGTTQKIGLASDVVVTGLVKTSLADVKASPECPWPMVARRRSLSIFFLNRRVAPPRVFASMTCARTAR